MPRGLQSRDVCPILMLLIALFARLVAAAEVDTRPLPLKVETAFPNVKWPGWESAAESGIVNPLRPILVTHAGDGSNRVFIPTQQGVVYVLPNDQQTTNAEVFLDIEDKVSYDDKTNEEGFLGLAFHPKFRENGQFFVYYTNKHKPHQNVVARYRASDSDRKKADPGSEEILLVMDKPFWNHDGGTIAFGMQIQAMATMLLSDLWELRVAGGADVDELDVAPGVRRDRGEVHLEAVLREGVGEDGAGAGQIGRALVDLVEGVRAEHAGIRPAPVDHRLGEGEQGLAGAEDRQHLGRGIGRWNAVAPADPVRDGPPQGLRALGGRIGGEPAQVLCQDFLDEGGRLMLGFADGKPDLAEIGRGRDAREQGAQLLEGIGLQQVEAGIHDGLRGGECGGLS